MYLGRQTECFTAQTPIGCMQATSLGWTLNRGWQNFRFPDTGTPIVTRHVVQQLRSLDRVCDLYCDSGRQSAIQNGLTRCSKGCSHFDT